jgi:uncharacterized membrane protein
MSNITDTPDTTGAYSQQEIESGKAMAIIAYIIVLIPLFASKDNRFVRFHTNQGLILLILAILYSFVYRILLWIFGYGFIITIVGLLGLVITALCIIGIVNAASGKAKELPVIGGFKILN